jgi:hypothetical protein
MEAHASNLERIATRRLRGPRRECRGGLTPFCGAAYPGQQACPGDGRTLSDPSEMATGGTRVPVPTRRADQ